MMKRYLTLILSAAALHALAGCSREPLAEDSDREELLGAMIVNGAATRTAYDGNNGAFSWETGDEVAIFQTNGTAYKVQVRPVIPGTASGGSIVYSQETGYSRSGYAVYPASAVTNASWDGTALTVTLPASYDASTAVKLPLVAENSGTTLTFRPVAGLLRIKCDNIPDGTTALAVTVNGENSITGTYPVEGLDTATPRVNAVTGTAQSVTFTVSGTSATLNLPLPCGDYSGVTVTAGSKSATKTFDFTAERGVGKKVHVLSFE